MPLNQILSLLKLFFNKIVGGTVITLNGRMTNTCISQKPDMVLINDFKCRTSQADVKKMPLAECPSDHDVVR